MTTDSGVDLVAYSPLNGKALTIQVKTNLKAKPGGGKGKAALDWWIAKDSPAQYVAFVELGEKRIWLFAHPQIASFAQQTSRGRHHFYMYLSPDVKTKTGKASHCCDFDQFLFAARLEEVFGI